MIPWYFECHAHLQRVAVQLRVYHFAYSCMNWQFLPTFHLFPTHCIGFCNMVLRLYWIRFTINMQLKNIQLSGKINSYSLSCLHLFCSKHRRFHEVLAWIHPSQLKWITITTHISKLKFKNFMHFHWAPIPVNKMVLMVLIVFFPESGINSWVT